MGKGSQIFFKAVVNELSESLPTMGESGSKVSYFITEPRKFTGVNRLSSGIRKPRLDSTLKGIQNLINNRNFLVEKL